ncbi:DNA topoisomerase I, partial [Candidatus Saccharibacteria bacterium]|nr:DNA topoisomerase I [Candidatus Saccharibacteria bacterium]
MSKNLVIVESPAKAHTIEKYLGPDFQVLASVGHIRKDTKVDKNTFDVTYEIDPGHKSVISELKKAVKAADKVWLATDEDREGEAISWHLCEVLKLPKDTARITFHEITKSALEEAIKSPRTVDMDMVASQQARQTLDMLVGFDLSGIVRKKVPGAISAGRVQSPALRLVVEREQQIEKFNSTFSYKVKGDFGFEAKLNQDFDDTTSLRSFLEQLIGAKYTISAVETSPGTRKPAPPFTTASMQIEA